MKFKISEGYHWSEMSIVGRMVCVFDSQKKHDDIKAKKRELCLAVVNRFNQLIRVDYPGTKWNELEKKTGAVISDGVVPDHILVHYRELALLETRAAVDAYYSPVTEMVFEILKEEPHDTTDDWVEDQKMYDDLRRGE
jgi:hypothetical protein